MDADLIALLEAQDRRIQDIERRLEAQVELNEELGATAEIQDRLIYRLQREIKELCLGRSIQLMAELGG